MKERKKLWTTIFLLVLSFIVGLIIFLLRYASLGETLYASPISRDELVSELKNDALNYDKENLLVDESREQLNSGNIRNEDDNGLENNQIDLQDKFPVYITGEIKNPGIYNVIDGSYLYELIEMADGFTAEAAVDIVNLASKVVKESHIKIYSKAEAERLNLYEEYFKNSSENIDGSDNFTHRGKININQATKEDFMTLPGIGEVLATEIIAFRELNGNFGHIEDLMNISGIKENKFSKFKDFIIV